MRKYDRDLLGMGYGLGITEFMRAYGRSPRYDLRGWVWCRNCESCPYAERTENGFVQMQDTVRDVNGERFISTKRHDGAIVCPICGSANVEVPESAEKRYDD